jgi:hypothetical protein
MSEVLLEACPHCGSTDCFHYAEYGCIVNYTGTFGGTIEHTEIGYTRPPAVYAKCDECGKKIKLSDLRER